jgi:uncharacterized protein (DUF952 family)
MIYHITTPINYSKFDVHDYYEADSLKLEGFIHCSTANQLKGTAARYYGNEPEIVLLCIDESKLNAELKFEMAKIGEEFPHVFGSINKSAIVALKKIRQSDGAFAFDLN